MEHLPRIDPGANGEVGFACDRALHAATPCDRRAELGRGSGLPPPPTPASAPPQLRKGADPDPHKPNCRRSLRERREANLEEGGGFLTENQGGN